VTGAEAATQVVIIWSALILIGVIVCIVANLWWGGDE